VERKEYGADTALMIINKARQLEKPAYIHTNTDNENSSDGI